METARDVTSNVASQVDNAASNVAEKGSEANAGFAGAPRRFQFKRKPWNATPSGISLSISNFTASFTTASAVTSSDSWRNLVLVPHEVRALHSAGIAEVRQRAVLPMMLCRFGPRPRTTAESGT